MEKKSVKSKKAKTKAQQTIKVPRKMSPDIRSDYYSRFRFNREELLSSLKEASGKKFTDIPRIYQCLDDLGYWTLVRESDVFNFTEELEQSINFQFDLLNKSFNYSAGDLLIWGDLNKPQSQRFQVRLVECVAQGDQELYRVEVLGASATIIVSRYELDFWNATGSTLPADSLGEVIDWDRDFFWLTRLRDFKEVMAAKSFQFNFNVDKNSLEEQQQALLIEIQKFFSLNKGPVQQRNRGLGMLSCGHGTESDNALVLAMALQALGQPFGIRARLWGNGKNFSEKPQYVMISTINGQEHSEQLQETLLKKSTLRPVQRPLSEVLRRLIANGPFGKAESNALVRGSLAADQTESLSQQKI